MIFSPPYKSLIVKGAEIHLQLKARQGRRGSMVIYFSDQGDLVLESTGALLGEEEIQFLKSKERWIYNHHKKLSVDIAHRKNFHAQISHSIPLLGVQTQVEWVPSGQTRFRYEKFSKLKVEAPQNYILNHKKQLLASAGRSLAKGYLQSRLNKWALHTQLKYNRLSVKDHVSKWGSCSVQGNINLNWNLIWLEEALVDYVIVHELMHLKEMNHGPDFWKLVKQVLPDYKILDKQVNEKQWVIGILR